MGKLSATIPKGIIALAIIFSFMFLFVLYYSSNYNLRSRSRMDSYEIFEYKN